MIDRATGPNFEFSIFYVVPLILATWWAGRLEGLIIGLASTASWFVADVVVDPVRVHSLRPYWEAVVQVSFFVVMEETLWRLRVRTDRDQAFLNEVQRNLLPGDLPRFAGLDIACSWQPASAVGGDYYDVVDLGGHRLGFCIGDVSGKGVNAALIMSNLQAAFRVLAPREPSPSALCAELNRHLCKSVTIGRFVTFFYGVLDVETGSLVYTNAGHAAPHLLRRNGATRRLAAGGPVLGFFQNGAWNEGEEHLESGDRLLLVTDGLTEARNAEDEEFGEERVGAILASRPQVAGKHLISTLLDEVRRFNRGHFEDDVTLMTITVLDGFARDSIGRPETRPARPARLALRRAD